MKLEIASANSNHLRDGTDVGLDGTRLADIMITRLAAAVFAGYS